MTFRAGFVHWDSMRYVALLALLGWTALALALGAGAQRAGARQAVAAAVATACLVSTRHPVLASPAALAGLAAVAVALGPAAAAVRRGRRPGRLAAAAAAAVPLLVAGLVLWRHDAKAAASEAAISREPLFGRAAAVLDAEPPGTRVAIFGDQWTYPAFGARGHLVPVRLDGDGHLATAPIGDAMTPGPVAVSPTALMANLQAAGIGVVVVLHLPHPGRAPDRPSQDAALLASGRARLLYRDASATIWAVDHLRAPDR
jgi:hypothetical protein